MEYNFRKTAQDSTLLCKLMSGKKKLETKDVIGKTLTVTRFDFAPKFDQSGNPVVDDSTGEQDVFGVITFKENDGYYCVGTVFTKVCKMWAADFGGDQNEASDVLEKQGGVKVKFTEGKTKRGNNLVNVEIL